MSGDERSSSLAPILVQNTSARESKVGSIVTVDLERVSFVQNPRPDVSFEWYALLKITRYT